MYLPIQLSKTNAAWEPQTKTRSDIGRIGPTCAVLQHPGVVDGWQIIDVDERPQAGFFLRNFLRCRVVSQGLEVRPGFLCACRMDRHAVSYQTLNHLPASDARNDDLLPLSRSSQYVNLQKYDELCVCKIASAG